VDDSCAALQDAFIGVQDSGLVSYSCTRFPNPDSPRDALLAGLLVSIGTAFVSGVLYRAARAHTAAAIARAAGGRLRVAALDGTAALAAATPLRVAAPAWRDALLRWRWRMPPLEAANAAGPPRLVRAAAYLAVAQPLLDTAIGALAKLATAGARPLAVVHRLVAPSQQQQEQQQPLSTWASLTAVLWLLLVGLTLGALTLIAANEGAPALGAFFFGVGTALAVDQVVQWRDVYQELFEVLLAQLAAEALRLKAASGLFGEALDYFSTQSLLFGSDGDAEEGAGPYESELPRSGGGFEHIMVLWLASRAVGEE
jgi:hypothetical protein